MRAPNKGKTCKRFKRVKSVFGGTVRRCAKFGGSRRTGTKRKCRYGVNKVTGKCLKHRRRK